MTGPDTRARHRQLGVDSDLVREFLIFAKATGYSLKQDIVARLTKMTWQDVVAEKRRGQAEAIIQFTALDGNTEFDKVDGSVALSKFASDKEIIGRVASGEVTCTALIEYRIRK